MKYDTQSDFASSSSWSSFNASSTGGLDTVGYAGGVFDGRYVYFVPSFNGNMLRYDTTSSQASYDLRFTDSSRLSGALPRTTFLVNTPTNVLYLSLNENLPPGWNYIAASYDGSMMKLYLNGELKKSRAASGMIQTSTTPVNIGRYVDGNGYLNGIMDEVAIWNRSLSDTEILDIYNRSP
ncbi:LamG domain-containing protein [Candidatus Woesearchaeota archaeon]|nr:LamG domain-containing protein [Candidatus Woesearchaeota archaeon]